MLASFEQLWDQSIWMRLGVLAVLALASAAVLRAIVRAIFARLARRSAFLADLKAKTSMPLDWLLPLLLLSFALHSLPAADLRRFELPWRLLVIVLIGLTTWLVVRCIHALVNAAVRRHPLDVVNNLQARRIATQVQVLGRVADVVVILLGAAAALMRVPGAEQLGASLLASAGIAGLAFGLAAKPVLSNLVAGLQIALTQPIRLDDVVIIEGEWGRIEEITGTYVIVRIWDERRMVVPLNWFIEHPFQNWTRTGAQLIGSVFLWLDYRVPMEPLREELNRLCKAAPEWDGRVCVLQVTDANERGVQLRALVSSADSGLNWDLRCRVREGLIAFVQANYPEALPRWRAEWEGRQVASAARSPVHPSAAAMPPSPSAEDGGPRRGRGGSGPVPSVP
ncbi:MAG: mechanosensitive ion channel [Fulvimonas sp.]|nr:mechanosensitive ion channel [Fulvimonas sp.]